MDAVRDSSLAINAGMKDGQDMTKAGSCNYHIN